LPGRPVAEVRGLTVKYNRVVALDNVDLDIYEGRVLIMGPNGSGKTTLLKTLVGLIRPSRGLVRVLGLDPLRHTSMLYERIVFVRDSEDIPLSIKVSTHVNLLKSIYGEDKVEEGLDILKLRGHISKRFSELSKGYRRRLVILEALVADRDLILLDEPFIGLDSDSRAVISEALQHVRGNLVVSSHIPLNIEFNQLIVIESGKVTYSGEFREEIAQNYLSRA